VPGVRERDSLELAVRWGGVHRSSGYLKGKAKGRDKVRLSFEWRVGWGRRESVGERRTLYGERLLDYSK
jgi:hypothetical protein